MAATGAPARSVISKVTLAVDDDALATAIPLSVLPGRPGVPADSTYTRKALLAVTGTPASVIVTPAGLYENTIRGVGLAPPEPGVIRMEPEAVLDASPDVANFWDVRRGIE